jgi:fibronectin type 3 domain-containing protein
LPSAPENLQAIDGVGYIELTWDPPASDGDSPILNYRIYKGTAPDSETFFIEIGNVTTYNDTSVTPGIVYYYKVSAVNGNGEGPLSNEAFAKPPTIPFAPLNLVATGEMGYIHLTWDEPSSDGGRPITNYKIYRGEFSGGEIFYVEIGNITTYDDNNVSVGKTYFYRVSAVNIVGEGTLSNEYSAAPLAVPTEPLNLVADAGPGYIVLTWDPPTSDGGFTITNYRIYKGTSPDSETFYWEIGNLTTFNDTSVSPGITYFYKVTAKNVNGEGPLSNEASATPPNVPFAPLNLGADAGVGYIVLTWEAPSSDGGSPITNYRIYKGTASDSEIFLVEIGNMLTYNDTNVSPGVTYYYKVTAVNAVGEGPLSNQASATPPTVPTAPLNLTASTGDGYVYLSWSEPGSDGGSPIIEYYIYRDDVPGLLATVPASQEWYNDTNVMNGEVYIYNVSAVNAVGEGPNATVSAMPAPPIIPSPPMSPMVSLGNKQVNITWDPPTNEDLAKITNYSIYRNGSSEVYAIVSPDQLWYVDQNVTPGINYTYEVTANNDNGEGEPTTEVTAKAGENPAAPREIVALPADNYILIVWEPPVTDGGYQITNYTVYRGTNSGEEELLTQIGNVLLFNDTEAENDITYYYRIVAVNDIGESDLSESISAISTINEPPSVIITSPSTLTNIKGKFEILGTSSDPENSVHRVEIKIDGDNWVRVSGTTSWSHEWDTTSVPNGLHKITARAYDGQKYSPEINVTILVDNQESETDPLEGAWIGVMIGVIAFILLYLFWFFRKRQPKDMPDGQIYEIIHQKYFEGEISKETFEDFKKRYKTD